MWDFKRIICEDKSFRFKKTSHPFGIIVTIHHRRHKLMFSSFTQADSNKTRIDEANQRATKMLGSG